MNSFFLDTSYIIALELKSDQYHNDAKQHWQSIISIKPKLVTTSYIFDEIVTFFNSRNFHAKAVEIGQRILYDSNLQFIQVDEYRFNRAWEYFKQHNDKSYSLTDCISFIVMKQLGISIALTFDNHFIQAGFQKLP